MRKSLSILAGAAALALPLIGFGTAAHATTPTTPTCTKASGTVTFTPPLPTSGSTVKSKVKLTGKESSCSGGGVTAAKLVANAMLNKSTNCSGVANDGSVRIVGTLTLTWKVHKTSTASFTLKPESGERGLVTGTITKGQFKGKSLAQTLQLEPTSNGGNCESTPLKKAGFVQSTPLVIK